MEESDHLPNWQPPITGEAIMDLFDLAPSKPVGILKNALKDAILDGIIPNTYEEAYAYLVEKAKELNLKIKKS